LSTPNLGPCTLKGTFVSLEPLRKGHTEALLDASAKLDWDWFLKPLHTREDVERRIAEGLEAEAKGEAYIFAVLLKENGRTVGSTSYFGVVADHKKVEIGSTWYTADTQGTTVNPECKYLLLSHAFDDWGAMRVQFTTDVNNLHSQHAILKLGAAFEGRLRNDKRRQDGSMRDSMVYSIVAAEWPEVREKLETRLYRPQRLDGH
jgi:N-acetyltransferase